MYIGWTLSHIIEMVGGETTLDHSFLVRNIASLTAAGPHDVAIVYDRGDASVFDETSSELIKKSSAGLIIARKPYVQGKNYLIVSDPLHAFQTLVHAKKQRQNDAELVHATALIHATARVGKGTVVGAYAVLDENVQVGASSVISAHAFIGKECIIGSNVFIHPGVKILERCVIGDETIIHANSVIGSDGFGYQVNSQGMQKIPHIGNVVIGKGVEIGANVSIDRAVFDATVLGNGVKIDNNVHLAHGVQVGDHTAILALTGVAGSARIGMGCQIGGQVGIKDHTVIGNRVKIVAQSAVLKDVPDNLTVAGTPAIPFNEWKRMMVGLGRLPELLKKAASIEQTLGQEAKKTWWRRLTGR